MRHFTLSSTDDAVEVMQNSNGVEIQVPVESIPELIKALTEEQQKIETARNKVTDVTIKATRFWLTIDQDYENSSVCIDRDELPKLIRILQKIQEEG